MVNIIITLTIIIKLLNGRNNDQDHLDDASFQVSKLSVIKSFAMFLIIFVDLILTWILFIFYTIILTENTNFYSYGFTLMNFFQVFHYPCSNNKINQLYLEHCHPCLSIGNIHMRLEKVPGAVSFKNVNKI